MFEGLINRIKKEAKKPLNYQVLLAAAALIALTMAGGHWAETASQ